MQSVPFRNRYVQLGKEFSVETRPEPVENPELIKFNYSLAKKLGLLDTCFNPDHDLPEATAIFSGNRPPVGAEPLSMVYAGHQFGYFNPQLGDGRAILIGEVETTDARTYGIQLKGSGQTVFSRNGDGRAALGPVLREYLLSEAMSGLGVPTTRALAVVATGEQVAREQLLPGGIITRVASSFVRVGTFQYFSAQDDLPAIKKLADFVIEHNYPEVQSAENMYIALFESVVERQAVLVAKWMHSGFIHGVMNTDNMSIAGETIDYGPCAFMDSFNHDQVFSSIDRDRRYAYSNQPSIGLWNLTRLAETLVPLLAEEASAGVEIAQDILKGYITRYQQNWLDGMRDKLGLLVPDENDKALIDELLDIMSENRADFTLTFYYLSQLNIVPDEQDSSLLKLFEKSDQPVQWLAKWRRRVEQESLGDEVRQCKMQSVNPVYIPRNHQVEAAIRAAEDNGDFSVFHDLHEVLQKPFERQPGKDEYMLAPEPGEVVRHTFCGT
ncbi:MAG TPA: YdiU family protein [Gammaproteobacteria bacterium]|nr:YdiU family protein [Gammaproteobacteria bacterium]